MKILFKFLILFFLLSGANSYLDAMERKKIEMEMEVEKPLPAPPLIYTLTDVGAENIYVFLVEECNRIEKMGISKERDDQLKNTIKDALEIKKIKTIDEELKEGDYDIKQDLVIKVHKVLKPIMKKEAPPLSVKLEILQEGFDFKKLFKALNKADFMFPKEKEYGKTHYLKEIARRINKKNTDPKQIEDFFDYVVKFYGKRIEDIYKMVYRTIGKKLPMDRAIAIHKGYATAVGLLAQIIEISVKGGEPSEEKIIDISRISKKLDKLRKIAKLMGVMDDNEKIVLADGVIDTSKTVNVLLKIEAAKKLTIKNTTDLEYVVLEYEELRLKFDTFPATKALIEEYGKEFIKGVKDAGGKLEDLLTIDGPIIKEYFILISELKKTFKNQDKELDGYLVELVYQLTKEKAKTITRIKRTIAEQQQKIQEKKDQISNKIYEGITGRLREKSEPEKALYEKDKRSIEDRLSTFRVLFVDRSKEEYKYIPEDFLTKLLDKHPNSISKSLIKLYKDLYEETKKKEIMKFAKEIKNTFIKILNAAKEDPKLKTYPKYTKEFEEIIANLTSGLNIKQFLKEIKKAKLRAKEGERGTLDWLLDIAKNMKKDEAGNYNVTEGQVETVLYYTVKAFGGLRGLDSSVLSKKSKTATERTKDLNYLKQKYATLLSEIIKRGNGEQINLPKKESADYYPKIKLIAKYIGLSETGDVDPTKITNFPVDYEIFKKEDDVETKMGLLERIIARFNPGTDKDFKEPVSDAKRLLERVVGKFKDKVDKFFGTLEEKLVSLQRNRYRTILQDVDNLLQQLSDLTTLKKNKYYKKLAALIAELKTGFAFDIDYNKIIGTKELSEKIRLLTEMVMTFQTKPETLKTYEETYRPKLASKLSKKKTIEKYIIYLRKKVSSAVNPEVATFDMKTDRDLFEEYLNLLNKARELKDKSAGFKKYDEDFQEAILDLFKSLTDKRRSLKTLKPRRPHKVRIANCMQALVRLTKYEFDEKIKDKYAGKFESRITGWRKDVSGKIDSLTGTTTKDSDPELGQNYLKLLRKTRDIKIGGKPFFRNKDIKEFEEATLRIFYYLTSKYRQTLFRGKRDLELRLKNCTSVLRRINSMLAATPPTLSLKEVRDVSSKFAKRIGDLGEMVVKEIKENKTTNYDNFILILQSAFAIKEKKWNSDLIKRIDNIYKPVLKDYKKYAGRLKSTADDAANSIRNFGTGRRSEKKYKSKLETYKKKISEAYTKLESLKPAFEKSLPKVTNLKTTILNALKKEISDINSKIDTAVEDLKKEPAISQPNHIQIESRKLQ